MGKITGFIEIKRSESPYRKPEDRLSDFNEIYTDHDPQRLGEQGARCMDCGVPFCQSHNGCPIHNIIPEWNDLVYKNQWKEALERLHQTNNFPEFTGRVCPAPCEGACVLSLTDPAVTIKNIEMAIIDKGFDEGWVHPQKSNKDTGKKIAIIGSGPAGLAAAEQLNIAGHRVVVYEREDRIGGLLMYGIPNMKLDKVKVVNRRINLMEKAGIKFLTNAKIGNESSGRNINELVENNNAVLLATGATRPRDLDIPGRNLNGIHFAMEYLTNNTKYLLNNNSNNDGYINVKDKDVIVIGGGDTGTDCIGTALRQNCKSLINFELLPQPPNERSEDNPWPSWPKILRTDYGHQESISKFGTDPRVYKISSTEFIGNQEGNLIGIKTVEVSNNNNIFEKISGTEKEWKADFVFLALGFLGPEHEISDCLKIKYDDRSNYKAEYGLYRTNIEKIFAAGDCRKGQSLVVNAINEGREAAREIDRYLMGTSDLP